MAELRSFGSDNNAGVHPRVLEAIAKANDGDAVAYGDDGWTRKATAAFRALLGERVEVFFVFGGTGANVTALAALCRPHQAVICAENAHIHVDECAAPERFAGVKLLAVPTADGKLRPEDVQRHLHGFGYEHHVQPRVISITQATEFGTVYSPAEVRALAELAHAHQMFLHVDGARFANAAAALGTPARALTADCGVDAMTFGGTKNGGLVGEAVVFFDPRLAADYKFIRKQGMQLPSKMRFVSAQYAALLEGDLWLANARHANAMAKRLADAVRSLPGLKIAWPVEANAVFAELPAAAISALKERYFFYTWDETRSIVRWMCSFSTRAEDVDAFAQLVREVIR